MSDFISWSEDFSNAQAARVASLGHTNGMVAWLASAALSGQCPKPL
jgi:hypothetical protein